MLSDLKTKADNKENEPTFGYRSNTLLDDEAAQINTKLIESFERDPMTTLIRIATHYNVTPKINKNRAPEAFKLLKDIQHPLLSEGDLAHIFVPATSSASKQKKTESLMEAIFGNLQKLSDKSANEKQSAPSTSAYLSSVLLGKIPPKRSTLDQPKITKSDPSES